MEHQQPARAPRDGFAIGVGLFLVLAGLLTLAEHAGLIPPMKWGLPVLALVIGGVILYNSLRR